MRLLKLNLNHFGKFHKKEINLEDGINLIYGDNEAGKSTIHSFIRGMLFGIEKTRGRASKEDAYLKYQPWDTPGAYHGSMDISIDNKAYRIIRNFDKNTKALSILDLDTGRELNLRPEDISNLYGGLTEAGYRNTISIEQLKARTDQELVQELRNYLTNLSLSKSNEVDVTKALAYLQEKKKEMDALKIPMKLASLEEEISEHLDYDSKIEKLSHQFEEMAAREKKLGRKEEIPDWPIDGAENFASIQEYKAHLEHFPVIREKYRSYQETLNLKKDLYQKLEQCKNTLQECEKNQKEYDKLKNSLEKLDTLKSNIIREENKKAQLADNYGKAFEMKGWMYLFPIIIGVLALICFKAKKYLPAFLCIGVAIGCIIMLVHLFRKWKAGQMQYHQECQVYDRHIQQFQSEISMILSQSTEQDLRNRLEVLLSDKLSMGHRTNQMTEYQSQIAIMNEKLSVLEEELYDYIHNTPFFSMDDFEYGAPGDILIQRLEQVINQRKQQLSEYQENIRNEHQTCRLQMEKLKWELEELEATAALKEEKLLEKKTLYKELLQKKVETEQETNAIMLAMNTIGQLSIEIHDSFGGKLNRKISELTSEITGGKYDDVKVDEKLNVKVGHKNNFVVLDKLSAGTIEQLYLALRMGIADMVYGEGSMPILLDDSFSLYDDHRAKAALKALSDKIGQVIIFTCQTREKALLDQMKVNYHYIDLSAE